MHCCLPPCEVPLPKRPHALLVPRRCVFGVGRGTESCSAPSMGNDFVICNSPALCRGRVAKQLSCGGGSKGRSGARGPVCFCSNDSPMRRHRGRGGEAGLQRGAPSPLLCISLQQPGTYFSNNDRVDFILSTRERLVQGILSLRHALDKAEERCQAMVHTRHLSDVCLSARVRTCWMRARAHVLDARTRSASLCRSPVASLCVLASTHTHTHTHASTAGTTHARARMQTCTRTRTRTLTCACMHACTPVWVWVR